MLDDTSSARGHGVPDRMKRLGTREKSSVIAEASQQDMAACVLSRAPWKAPARIMEKLDLHSAAESCFTRAARRYTVRLQRSQRNVTMWDWEWNWELGIGSWDFGVEIVPLVSCSWHDTMSMTPSREAFPVDIEIPKQQEQYSGQETGCSSRSRLYRAVPLTPDYGVSRALLRRRRPLDALVLGHEPGIRDHLRRRASA